MNPYVIYAMVALIIGAGFLTIKCLEWYESKHNTTMQE